MVSSSTPAKLLAHRIRRLSAEQTTLVRNWWRRYGEARQHQVEIENEIERSMAVWSQPERQAPLGDQTGWSARDEAISQRGLDHLLRHAHPDTGDWNADDPFVARDVTTDMRRTYQEKGWWHADSDTLVLPRRLATSPPGHSLNSPLLQSVVLTGEARESIAIIRPTETLAPDSAEDPMIRAGDCATVPLIDADAVAVKVFEDEGQWRYEPLLEASAVSEDLILKAVQNADTAHARVLVVPEYAASPTVVAVWQRVLQEQETRHLQWVMIGSGPTENQPSGNIAWLATSDGELVAAQPKIEPYDVPVAVLSTWETVGLPANPAPIGSVRENIDAHHKWSVIEAHTGRFAIAVCQSIELAVDNAIALHLGRAAPTLVLCPVLSKPTHVSEWERSASRAWAKGLTEVVVANSVVMSSWAAKSQPNGVPAWIGTAGYRHLNGTGWQVRYSPSAPQPETLSTVSLPRPGKPS